MYKFLSKPVIVLAVVLFCGCSEKDQPEIKANEIPVTFNVSALNVDIQPMSRGTNSGTDLWEVVNTIGYYIYNANDSYLHRQGKTSFIPGTDPVPDGFGQFREKLTPGVYNIVFYASGKGDGSISFEDVNRLTSGTVINYKNKEVFYYHEHVTVSATTKFIEIPMLRKSSMLKVNITDEATPDIGKVKFVIGDGGQWSVMEDVNKAYRSNTYEGVITNNKLETFEYYYSFPYTTSNVSILIYDKNGLELSKTDLVLPLFENRRTVVSGKLFSNIGNQEMNIIIDDIWGEDVEYPLN